MLTRLRESFWFVPALMCIGATVLAHGLMAMDLLLPADFGLVQVGASGSRDLLGAIAASMLAVASTTFSITIAVMALASSTYGPRLVRNFMADRGNQVVLGVFVSTFLYALLVLRSVRTEDDNGSAFVPQLAVSVAVLLAVASIGVLIYFIHHISDSIQVVSLSRQIRTDLHDCVERMYPDDGPDGSDGHRMPPSPALPADIQGGSVPVASSSIGYVRSIDEPALLALAIEHDVVVVVHVRPGAFVVTDQRIAEVFPAGRADISARDSVRDAISLAGARTPDQDVEFAVQQLEEMAVRALSPSMNDPYTAINALDDLSSGLSLMATRAVRPTQHYDDGDRLRLVVPRVELTELLDRVISAMRTYAIDHLTVLQHTITLAERVGNCTSDEAVHRTLRVSVSRLVAAYARTDPQQHDLDLLRSQADRLFSSLA